MSLTEYDRKKLVGKRSRIKATLKCISDFVVNFDSTTGNINDLSARLNVFNGLWSKYEEVQDALVAHDPTDTDADSFENLYFSTKSILDCLITTNQASVKTETDSEKSPCHSDQSVFQLEKMKLPEFDGDYNKWLNFRDTFVSLIHEPKSIPVVFKFHRLKSLLKGEPFDILQSLEVTIENYPKAWDLLCARYDNNKVIIQSHIATLFQLPKVEQSNSKSLCTLTLALNKTLRSLESLKLPVDKWDAILIHLACSKLDRFSLRAWEEHSVNFKDFSYSKLDEFLTSRCISLEAVESQTTPSPHAIQSSPNASTKNTNFKQSSRDRKTCMLASTAINNFQCTYCSDKSHAIYHCTSFKQLPIESKWQKVRDLKLCSVCLRENHVEANLCKLKSGCRTCGRAHNSILHFEPTSTCKQPLSQGHSTNLGTAPASTPSSHGHTPATPLQSHAHLTTTNPVSSSLLPGSSMSFVSNATSYSSEVLLPTAVVAFLDRNGLRRNVRIILDSGSQLNFVSQDIANVLSLPKKNSFTQILGVNNSQTNTSEFISTTLNSVYDDLFSLKLDFHIIPKISMYPVPFNSLDRGSLQIPFEAQQQLADPEFSNSLPVHGLLGAQAFFDLFSNRDFNFFKLNNLYFCKSVLGWIVSGTIPREVHVAQPNRCMVAIFKATEPSELPSDNSDFQDDLSLPKFRSREESVCEKHFLESHYRDVNGQFVVSLPFKADPNILGDSRNFAEKSFSSLERKFMKNPALKTNYSNFMKEYEELLHMSLVPIDQINNRPNYYLPHHPVFKHSTTTSIRVVFNASHKTTSGHSLNDIMYAAQPRQDSLFSIILRFRMYKYCISADVAKMYRQVRLDQSLWDCQRIVWRKNPEEPLKHYHLNTVTYGESAAPFLATRCLLQLAHDHKESFPLASQIIERDFFVDDCITGSDSLEEAKLIQRQVSSILSQAGMNLRKWCSNDASILESIPTHDDPHHVINITDDKESVSALGLCWIPLHDNLFFQLKSSFHSPPFTKRSIVSDLSKIFDPLGLITPVLIKGKIFVQELWQCKANWDDVLPDDLQDKWSRFSAELPDLNSIQIPRRASFSSSLFEIHGFSDSSQSAFGACVYVKSWDDANDPQIRLLTSKSRVAPLKTISLPRLELCAAVLLVRLVSTVISSLRCSPSNVIYWTDSQIVLSWISKEPCHYKTFVSNRVAEIQSHSRRDQWFHVDTKSNPSDLVSRGLTPRGIITNELWWHGPSWLHLPSTDRLKPVEILTIEELPDVKPIKYTLFTTPKSSDLVGDLIHKYSSWTKSVSVTSYILRYIHNLRVRAPKLEKPFCVPPLTVLERREATYFIIRKVQEMEFPSEVKSLASGRPLNPKNKLLPLNPFYHDETGLILVGGRISCAEFSYFKKHPILLPSNHHVTRLILVHYHETHLHIGAHSLIAIVRNRYWPMNGKAMARSVVHKCMTCFKAKPQFHHQMMADLPKVRVTPARPFLSTGIDFCGPFYLKAEFRKNVKYKAYVAVFVCLVTRAIHLELVTELTTDAFLASFRRFISRRGLCKDVYTDNATNFTGANKELKALFSKVKTQGNLQNFASIHEIQWHFIPPVAPHFGGIWEAAVKSAKHHLLRTIGRASLTYEEFSTFLCQVEACLNSRPLHPSSPDPNDCSALTPGHFLIGSPLTLPPDENYSNIPTNRLKRWNFLQARLQEFWKRWSMDYINTQQQRPKWLKPSANLTVGSLVIIREPNLPPLQWRLGRISEVHPGKDNLVRTATVHLADKTTLKRSVEKLCPLPMDEEDSE